MKKIDAEYQRYLRGKALESDIKDGAFKALVKNIGGEGAVKSAEKVIDFIDVNDPENQSSLIVTQALADPAVALTGPFGKLATGVPALGKAAKTFDAAKRTVARNIVKQGAGVTAKASGGLAKKLGRARR